MALKNVKKIDLDLVLVRWVTNKASG